MKKALVIAALFVCGVAAASCPIGTRYDCVQMPNGKMSCGCR
jgi:hypothetical protein